MQYICFDTNGIRLHKIVMHMLIYIYCFFSCRRQFFSVFDDVQNHCGDNNWHTISSGSKAKELDLPGSDFDVILINKNIAVYEYNEVFSIYHDLRTKLNLVLDFDNAMPGFTLLRIYDIREWNKELINIYEDGSFLSNHTWKRAIKRVIKHGNIVINGPCISDPLGTIDEAYCLKYLSGPLKQDNGLIDPG